MPACKDRCGVEWAGKGSDDNKSEIEAHCYLQLYLVLGLEKERSTASSTFTEEGAKPQRPPPPFRRQPCIRSVALVSLLPAASTSARRGVAF